MRKTTRIPANLQCLECNNILFFKTTTKVNKNILPLRIFCLTLVATIMALSSFLPVPSEGNSRDAEGRIIYQELVTQKSSLKDLTPKELQILTMYLLSIGERINQQQLSGQRIVLDRSRPEASFLMGYLYSQSVSRDFIDDHEFSLADIEYGCEVDSTGTITCSDSSLRDVEHSCRVNWNYGSKGELECDYSFSTVEEKCTATHQYDSGNVIECGKSTCNVLYINKDGSAEFTCH